MANRVLVVGWDGADWDILDPLLAAGELPALQALVERGQRGVARSCLPSHSWAAWPTFLTGRDPGGHGVFDILEYLPGATRRPPVSWQSILAPTWPDRLSSAGKSTLLVNVPLTYPPPAIDGVVIAGGVVPPRRTFSHPADAGPRLDWPINGGSWTTFRGRPRELLSDLESLTIRRAQAMRTLLDEEPWDAAALVFVSTDRAQHCLLEYVHPGHPGHARVAGTEVADRVRGLYRLLDNELATLLDRVDQDDLVIFMSDHGHHPCTRAVSMNKVLEHLGFLRFAPGSRLVNLLSWGRVRSAARTVYDRLGLHGRIALPTPPIDWGRTRAYTSVVSTGEGVSISLIGREPEGTVSPGDYERVRDEVAEALLAFADPETGTRPIGGVFRKEEVLSGPYLDRAPDLLLSPGPLYSLSHARRLVEKADWLSGDHRPEGVYVLAGPGIGQGHGPEVSLASFAGMIGTGVGLEPDESWNGDLVAATVSAYTEDEERLVEERLRGLGYLE
ncbi:MAG TPA: alkaline phosphatase family protein [Gaiellaceae bacterium]|jgi:predicted AlkP superfamily phosphohydrolase/phosphomutase|nr:alkaline phosphatase family protein [Gaiellaceae bacterium]